MPENHDIATANRQGLLRKLSGSSSDVLLGTGSFGAVPSVSGASYAPTVSAEANTTGTPTMSTIKYSRVGSVVTMSGQFTVDPVLTATITSFEFTLPVASNLGAASDVSGVAFCGAIAGMGAEIIAVAANDTAKVQWVSSDITSHTWSWTAQYTVI